LSSSHLKLEHRMAYPEQRRYKTPLLLLHGAWHGAWCWQPAMDDFAQRGFEVHAVSLRGHGLSDRPRSFNLVGIADYVRDLATAVASIEPKPVVVAHSMGGYVLQHYLMEQVLPRAVLLCSVPIIGALPFELRFLRRHPLILLRAILSLDFYQLVGTPRLAREAFFRETLPDHKLAEYSSQLGQEAYRAGLELSFGPRPNPARVNTRLLVIAAGRDQVFTIDEERATASAYSAELMVIPNAAHDLMLDSDWPVAADAIEWFVASGEAKE
jgi:pimeloyl-ACP methyl ester carboxylesterase